LNRNFAIIPRIRLHKKSILSLAYQSFFIMLYCDGGVEEGGLLGKTEEG